PPVCQTQLHVDVVLRRFRNHFVEMYESLFIPLSGCEPKVVMTWPVFEVGHRLDIIWPTLTERPHTHHFDSCLRSLTQSFRHAFAIFVAIHERDICTNKAKRLLTDHKPPTSLAYKLILWTLIGVVW